MKLNNTEQPGDAKHTPGQWKVDITFKKNGYYCTSLCSGDDGIIRPAIAEGLTREESIANAELIARAPALLSEVSTLRSKQAELVEENQRLKSQLKDYCNDCQHPTVNERQAAELSKLQSILQEERRIRQANEQVTSSKTREHIDELSKLRQENERYKEALQCMMNVEHHGDFMNAFFDLKDQVKAALQGE